MVQDRPCTLQYVQEQVIDMMPSTFCCFEPRSVSELKATCEHNLGRLSAPLKNTVQRSHMSLHLGPVTSISPPLECIRPLASAQCFRLEEREIHFSVACGDSGNTDREDCPHSHELIYDDQNDAPRLDQRQSDNSTRSILTHVRRMSRLSRIEPYSPSLGSITPLSRPVPNGQA